VFLYALEQIIFQKRLPTIRVFVCIIFYLYSVILFVEGGVKLFTLLRRFGLILFGVFAFVQFFTLIGFNVTEYGDLLIERFYTKDTVEETLEEDTRWMIGESFYKSLQQSGQFFSGRGIGSVVYDNAFLMSDENGKPYRSASEMGIPTIILKGGVPLLLFFGLILVKLVLMFGYVRKNIYLFASWSLVIVWFIFLYAEGFIGNNSSPYEITLAYALGLVLSKPSEARINQMIKSNV
jgi:hypothetical protein